MATSPKPAPAGWQPLLIGSSLRLRPLAAGDFEALYAAASDPAIWEMHPERDRHRREVFTRYFDSGLESKGALAVIDGRTGEIVGSSRFSGFDPARSSVEIGYTFLARRYWGGGTNLEMKTLMLDYAFRRVDHVLFYIGEENRRSRRAVEKLGATEVETITRAPLAGAAYRSVVYRLEKAKWSARER